MELSGHAGKALLMVASPQWLTTYPDACVGLLAMEGVVNPIQCPALNVHKASVEARIRERYAQASRDVLRALPEITAYEAYYRTFRKSYHVLLQLESVAAGRSISSGAALVEAMYIAELENLLLTAGHDLDKVQMPLSVSVAQGTEQYTHLSGKSQTLKAGDMYIADGMGILSSIIYGPDQRTRIVPETRRVIFTVYTPAGIAVQALQQHLDSIVRNVLIIAPSAQVIHQEICVGGLPSAAACPDGQDPVTL